MLGWGRKKSSVPQLSGSSSVSSVEGSDSLADQRRMLKVAAGDMGAYQELYENFKGPIMSYVSALVRNESVAEEVTQEVFLRVYRTRETYRAEAKFSTWLWTITRNACLDHLRKKKDFLLDDSIGTLADSDESRVEQIESPLSSAEELLIERAQTERIERCLGELTHPQREALSFRTLSDLSYEEISQNMRITLGSVKSLINRARQALLRCLQGGGHHA
jgi:RNA polymerase sigma-70 factor, ECF subfamily